MSIGFPASAMQGPGGASAFTYGALGPGSLAPGQQVGNQAQGIGAPASGGGLRIPPLVWGFVLLIVGYWGLHQSLKAV